MNERNIIDIGPQCFTDGDEEVINYKGDNYYKAFDAVVVVNEDGSTSHCVKRVNHPGNVHEDFYGVINEYEHP